MNLILGALVEPLGTVAYGHSLVSKVVKQNTIAIVGAGAIGIMHALYAKNQDYGRVLLINASRSHLDWCIQRKIVNEKDVFLASENLPEKILATTENKGVDAVYMCTSRSNTLMALKCALQYVRDGGCIDLVGGVKDDDQIAELPTINDLNAVRRANFCGIPIDGHVEKVKSSSGKGVYITGHRGTSLQHFQDAIEKLQNHSEIFNKVISHVVSPEAAVDLFNAIAQGPLEEFNKVPYIKAVVDMKLAGKLIRNV